MGRGTETRIVSIEMRLILGNGRDTVIRRCRRRRAPIHRLLLFGGRAATVRFRDEEERRHRCGSQREDDAGAESTMEDLLFHRCQCLAAFAYLSPLPLQ